MVAVVAWSPCIIIIALVIFSQTATVIISCTATDTTATASASFVVSGGVNNQIKGIFKEQRTSCRRRQRRRSENRAPKSLCRPLRGSLDDGDAIAGTGRTGGGGAKRKRRQNQRRRTEGNTNTVEHKGHRVDAAAHRAAKNIILGQTSRLSVAPMMDYTDRHFRAMARLVSGRTLLYTEMVAADDLLTRGRQGAVQQRDAVQQLLGQSAAIPEGPSVLQLGGNDASQLYEAANVYHKYSGVHSCEYTALNLNCGCPSPSVSGKKRFGAALMKDPAHVARLVRAMHDGVDGRLPITVKCRIGLHDASGAGAPFSRRAYEEARSSRAEYAALRDFVGTVAADGIATHFQVHARVAVLGGALSPADNRRIPPLRYGHVHQLARDFPELQFVLNGGVRSLSHAQEELEAGGDGAAAPLAGIMVGRAFVGDPWGFATADEALYGECSDRLGEGRGPIPSDPPCPPLPRDRREVLRAYGRHADREERRAPPAQVRRALVAACAHLFAGEAYGPRFRRDLDEIAGRPARLEREATVRAWSGGGADGAAAAFTAAAAPPAASWDALQARDDARPAWDAREPPLSELIMEAAQRNFGDEVLERSRSESYEKKLWEEEEARRRRAKGEPVLFIGADDGGKFSNSEKVSGGVVDGWFNNGLD